MGRVDFATLFVVASWFIFHSLLGITNKCIFRIEGARFPILLTSFNMLTTFGMGHAFLKITEKKEQMDVVKLFLEHGLSAKNICLSVVFSLSVALGNISLQYIGLPFAQMISALTPVLTMLLDLLLHLLSQETNRPKYTTMAFISMLLLMAGAVLSTMGEVNFVLFGFLCALTATSLRSLRGLLQEYLLKGETVKKSFHLLYLMSLPSFIILFTFGIYLERHVVYNFGTLFHPKVFSLVVFSSLVAFGYNAFGLLVSLKISAVATHILGNVKMVFCIAASLIVLNERATMLSWVGVFLTFLGGGLFWYGKQPSPQKMKSN